MCFLFLQSADVGCCAIRHCPSVSSMSTGRSSFGWNAPVTRQGGCACRWGPLTCLKITLAINTSLGVMLLCCSGWVPTTIHHSSSWRRKGENKVWLRVPLVSRPNARPSIVKSAFHPVPTRSQCKTGHDGVRPFPSESPPSLSVSSG
jgi:hypothetical protein